MSAPVRAAPTTTSSRSLDRSTIPATVVATATPTVRAPTTWNTAASVTAEPGRNALVTTGAAMALPAS